MNDPDQTITFSSIQKTDSSYPQKSDGLDDAWTEDEFTTDEENPTVDRAAAFVSLAFITAALKRSAWLLCATAIFGLIIGYALYAKFPPSYSAKTSVLLSGTTNADPTQQSNTNVALAQSQAVAQRALNQLGSATERQQLHRGVHGHGSLGPGARLPGQCRVHRRRGAARIGAWPRPSCISGPTTWRASSNFR